MSSEDPERQHGHVRFASPMGTRHRASSAELVEGPNRRGSPPLHGVQQSSPMAGNLTQGKAATWTRYLSEFVM